MMHCLWPKWEEWDLFTFRKMAELTWITWKTVCALSMVVCIVRKPAIHGSPCGSSCEAPRRRTRADPTAATKKRWPAENDDGIGCRRERRPGRPRPTGGSSAAAETGESRRWEPLAMTDAWNGPVVGWRRRCPPRQRQSGEERDDGLRGCYSGWLGFWTLVFFFVNGVKIWQLCTLAWAKEFHCAHRDNKESLKRWACFICLLSGKKIMRCICFAESREPTM